MTTTPNLIIQTYTIITYQPSCTSFPDLDFLNIIKNNFQDHVVVFTDRSKSNNSPAIGTACAVPSINYHRLATLPKLASVFTAECTALDLAVRYANKDLTRSYLICCSSLSVLQSLQSKQDRIINKYSASVKIGIKEFSKHAKGNNLSLLSIPSHTGISDNETTDIFAKLAVQQLNYTHSNVPHSDLFQYIKQSYKNSSEEFCMR